MVETPTYDLTVFQVHYGQRTLKIYTQGERVLRIEVIVHHTKELHGGRSVEYFPKIVTQSEGDSGERPTIPGERERPWRQKPLFSSVDRPIVTSPK